MKRLVRAAALLVALDAFWSLAAAGCASDLTATPPPGNDKCDAMGACPTGYVCQSGMCVTPGGATSTGTGGHGGNVTSSTTHTSTSTGGHAGSSGHGGMGGATSSTGMAGSTASGTGGKCSADLMTDPKNCGTCGNVCPAPVHGSGTPICKSGACDVDCAGDAGSVHSCPVNQGKDHVCVDEDDPQYCGSSCAACKGGTSCQSGSCKTFCLPPLSMCNGVCVDTQSDPNNCGSCNNKCGGLTVGAYCNAGACVAKGGLGNGPGCGTLLQCGSSPYSCSGTNDPFHCGSCNGNCGNSGLCATGSCENYILASGQWECGNGNSLTNWCPPTGAVPYGVCTDGSACP